MGYYLEGQGDIQIPPENEQAALAALHRLNWRNDLKTGGRSPRMENPPAEGPREDKWFSWMEWNYHESTHSVDDVLAALGFEIVIPPNNTDGYRDLYYSGKSGDQDVFLAALIPFLKQGYMAWTGEDGETWAWQVEDGYRRRGLAEMIWGEWRPITEGQTDVRP